MSGYTGTEGNGSLGGEASTEQESSQSTLGIDTDIREMDEQDVKFVENRIVLRKMGPGTINYKELYLKNMPKKKTQAHGALHFIPSVPVKVKITSYNKDNSKINPNLYIIEVEHGDFHWTVRRRYHHFMHLYRHFQFMKTAMNIPLSTQSYRHRRERSAIRVKENSNRAVRFPFRPEALVPADMMNQRVKQLQDYLNSTLTQPLLVQTQNMCDFLEVSRMSFIDQLGEKLKEGWVKKRSGDASSDGIVHYLQEGTIRHCFCCYALAICGVPRGSWETRWLFLKDSYLGYLRRDTGEIGAIILMDRGFRVSCGTSMGLKNAVVITNLTRQLILRDWTKRKAQEWIDSIEHVVRSTGKDFTEENRFNSFAPPRPQSKCSWFVDGKEYMTAVADAINAAQEEIFIADWWLSPEIYMKRPFVDGDKWRLDNLLYRKAKEGVQIFILLYKEVELALGINSLYTKKTLSKKHNNIKVLRHPDHVAGKSTRLLWAHHEKLVIVDQSVAFVGGIDLCYGRWDDEQHRLTDLGSMSASSTQVPVFSRIQTSNTVGQHLPNTLMSLAKSTNQITFGALAVDPANRLAIRDKGKKTKRESVCSEDAHVMGKRATVMRTMRDLKTRGREWADEIKDKGRHLTVRRGERPTRRQPTIEESPDNSDDDSGEDSLHKATGQDVSSGLENPSLLEENQVENLEPQGSAKYWIGKDYTNFIVKDFVDLDKPAQDGVDRLTTPRMPWHDIACAVTGPAARDAARHFIQRWNAIKVEKIKEHPRYPFLVPKSYEKSSFKTLDAVNADFTHAECQVIRSVSDWSAGVATKETSILEAYLSAIKNAKHYIYIENQFFITSTSSDDGVVNTIGKALCERILQAHREGTRFRVIVVLPLLPGFQGQIGTNTGTAMQAILHWNYASICRGSTSLLGNLRGAGIDPMNYITFYGLRTHSEMNKQPVTELVYVHSKLMIVDDLIVICGSANINDRSMIGKRDSEVALIIQDTEYTDSLMDGKPYKAGKYAFSLRKRLFREHLGLLSQPDEEAIDIRDPISDVFYKETWIRIAALNTKAYEEVFRCIPCDQVTTFDELREFQTKLPLSFTEPLVAQHRIDSEVQGYLVLLPLNFLSQENLKPPAASAEGLMPTSLWT